MVLGKLPVQGRPTNLDYVCACSRCGWGGYLDIFLSYIIFLVSLGMVGWLVVFGLTAL